MNVGRPYEVWNVPVVLTDPFDGRPVTIYTYPAAYAGAAFNQNKRAERGERPPDYFHSFEVTVNKRFSRRWNMSSSFWMTKTHEWIRATPTNPNDDLFPVNDTWAGKLEWTAITASRGTSIVTGNLRAASGATGQRTQTFSDARLRQGAVTLRMEHYGAQQGPMVPVTSMRAGQEVQSGRADTRWT